ncbi:MAG: response regulator [Eubacteriales bacterium]|nr:response regulator [Eubacteriales bacterium]
MKIALIDCDHTFTSSFVPLLRHCMDTVGISNCVLDVYDEPQKFLNRTYTTGEYFMILMDLYQPGTNGIEVAGAIRVRDEEVPIVFISSINEYATETYMVDAAYLLMKPIDEKKCFRILNRVLHRMCPQSWELKLADGFICHMIDIAYIRIYDHCFHLYLDDGGEHLVQEIDEEVMEKMMQVYRCFYRVTPDSVVNMAHITAFRDADSVNKDMRKSGKSKRNTGNSSGAAECSGKTGDGAAEKTGIELSGRYSIAMEPDQIRELRNHISGLQIEIEMNELCRV